MLDTVVAETDVKIRSKSEGLGIVWSFMGRTFSKKPPKREMDRK